MYLCLCVCVHLTFNKFYIFHELQNMKRNKQKKNCNSKIRIIGLCVLQRCLVWFFEHVKSNQQKL